MWPVVVDATASLFAFSARMAPEAGLVCEFGVRGGGSVRHIIREFGRPVYGFDSFAGLPEPWFKGPSFEAPIGYFASEVPEIGGLTVVEGLFEDTVPAFFAEYKEPIRFAHIDCDLYSSTKTVLDAMRPNLVPGSVIQFDELCKFELSNYDYWRDGEWRALEESGLEWEPLARTRHEQAVIRIVGNGRK